MDAIFHNLPSCDLVGQTAKGFPGRKAWAQTLRKRIGSRLRGVSYESQSRRVDVLEDALQEVADRMIPKVAGNQPDAQALRLCTASPSRMPNACPTSNEVSVSLGFLER